MLLYTDIKEGYIKSFRYKQGTSNILAVSMATNGTYKDEISKNGTNLPTEL